MLTSRLLGGLVLLKAVDVAERGPQALPTAGWLLVLAVWAGSGLALVAGRQAWAGVLVGGAGIAVDLPLELRRQHLVLLLGVALAALVAREAAERRLLWRLQLSTLYGTAALAKLNESVLGGDVLAGTLLTGPLGVLPPTPVLLAAGVALVAVEAGLAVGVWRAPVAALCVAAALHGSALVVASADPLVGLRLVVFGGTAVVLCAACAGLLPVSPSAERRRAGRPPPPAAPPPAAGPRRRPTAAPRAARRAGRGSG